MCPYTGVLKTVRKEHGDGINMSLQQKTGKITCMIAIHEAVVSIQNN